MRENVGPPSGCHIGSIFWRPTTMFPDHENPSNIAAAAAPAPSTNEASSPEPSVPPGSESATQQAESANGAPAAPAPAPAHEATSASAETHSEAPADPEAVAAAEEAASSEEMSKLMQEFDEKQEAAASHEVVEVKVVAYTEHGVVVDLGGKTEGLIPAAEFAETEIPRPDPNATIEVQRSGEVKDGYEIVSYQKVLRRRTWEKIDAAFKAKETIAGKVVDSRRAILEEELHAKRAALMETLSEGQIVHGHVKNVTDYGAFVDLGGIDGLLHLTDLSWGRVKHPSDVVKPEQELDVIILKFDKEKQRISLGLKQLAADPWAGAAERYPAGGKVQGTIVGIVDYGVFVELERGIEGLVHVSEMSWNKKVSHPSKLVKVGDAVDVVVLDIKPSDRRVSLGMKQAQPDPWLLTAEKYPVGTVITGKVRNIAEFGAL